MGAHVSAAVTKALALIASGTTPGRAAVICKIYPSTIYKALGRAKAAKEKELTNQHVAPVDESV